MFPWLVALVPAAFFVRGFRRDRRRVSNAMWLGVTVVVSAMASTSALAGYAFALVMLGVGVVLPIVLIFNGLEMLRRESRRPANLAMRDYLVGKGLSAADILVENKSTTTEQNLRFSTELLAGHHVHGPVAAVTNNYHAFRAAVTARRLGLPTEAIGAPTARYFLPSAFLREVIALLRENRLVHILLCGSMIGLYLIVLCLA